VTYSLGRRQQAYRDSAAVLSAALIVSRFCDAEQPSCGR